MVIKLLESTKVFYQETHEHEFEIDGEKHTLVVFDSPDEQRYWFDDEEYYGREDSVMVGLTIEDLLSWV